MADNCLYRISKAINDGCARPKKGFEQVGYIIDWEDIDQTSISIADNKCSFYLNSGNSYKVTIPGELPFNGTKADMVKGTYANTFTETLQFALLADSPENAAAMDVIKDRKFVFMLEKVGKSNGSQYRIFGLEGGMKCETATQDFYGDAAHIITMVIEGNTNSALFLEPTSSQFDADDFYNTQFL